MEFVNEFVIYKYGQSLMQVVTTKHNLLINIICLECGNLQINFQFIKVCLIARYHKTLRNLYAEDKFVYIYILEMSVINIIGWHEK